MHRDLKPGNILLKNGDIKLSDFGFAREILQDFNVIKDYTPVGSPLYSSPEVI